MLKSAVVPVISLLQSVLWQFLLSSLYNNFNHCSFFFIQPFYGGFSGLFRFLLLLKSFSILRRRTYQEFLELFSIVTHTHTRLTALCPGLPGWADNRKVKPIWILLKQETVSGSGISWAICKSAPRCRQITMPAPHYSVFTGRMPFLPPNQQRQSTEGT